ncbi:coiled-coil domain-containing protein 150 isoform X1 [Bufo gargarizans]|uniref:coiled-coil domain-containing protein 150 isoform X1 n=3 Tax=Bufo gargarizans TaxID=30331 RepID=UPI001CF5236A|nr:coiled-coil domain-containing protein 150 isoform X1 [Bufo gargarizans]XP_044147795.1 coiled-coil domain-containing protein 150 isoform X1 [Bufo gargarizans]
MARPVIPPLSILPTAPETFSVLEQRMRVAEEQAESLISELQALGLTRHQFTKFKVTKSAELIRPISPVRARPAFTGDGDTLWKNCENLVTRMCHMESVLHTLKLNIFRLHTDRELSTKHSGELEHRMLQMQEEHAQELKEAQLDVMRLRQRLNCAIEEGQREREAKERLSAALEIATTTKTDVAIAAEELKSTKACMSQRLAKLQDKLSQEAALRALLEEEQAALLLTVQDMNNVVEEERTQVQELQQYCQNINRESKEMKDKLENAESRCLKAERDNHQLRSEMEAKDSLVNQLYEEIKVIKQKCEEEQAELARLRADSVALREAAENVQCLNQQLENQCSELTDTVQRLTDQNLHLVALHQQELKVAQDTMAKKLQEQEAVMTVVQTSLGGEVQKMLSGRTQLERELESLRTEHSKCKERAAHLEQKTSVQVEMQENTIACLRSDLNSALQDKAELENEKLLLQDELYKTLDDLLAKKQNLEVQMTENKLEQELLQSSLWVQEQENKRLVERVAALEEEQHAKRQVELVLNELTDSKNKLAYEKGKLQSTVEQLQSDLQSFGDAQSENSKLRQLNAALQARYTQVNSELDSSKIQLQRLEAKFQQTEHLLLCKEEELALAAQARNEAIKEERRLKQQIVTLEETEGHAKSALQQQLSKLCEERTRMSETLENVLSSHAKLQKHLEILQTELGRKDNDLLSFHKDRGRSRKQIEKLKAELLECNTRLHAAEHQRRGEVEPLQKCLAIAQEDNRKLAQALDLALKRNSTLEKELENKELHEKQLFLNQTKAEEDYIIKQKLFEEQLLSLKKQHHVEIKEAKKAARMEVTEDLEAELKHMKNMKESYEKNNNEQCKHIQEFLNEVDSIRKEIDTATTQGAKESNLQSQLEEELTSRQMLEQRCKELECRVQELLKGKLDTESLRDANQQSEQVTVNLKEAHSWLKSNLDELQLQMLRNKQKSMKKVRKEFNNLKMSPYFPTSTLEHWETKQKLQLISRNLLLEDKTT